MRRSRTKDTGPDVFVRKPTSVTPDPSHLLRVRFVCCVTEVSDLINRPVVSLLGTRVGGTSTKVVVYIETTDREW